MQLLHRRILITAPRSYARKLSSLLIDAGARPIWLPAIEITSLPTTELTTVDAALAELSDYSHIAFTSRNGIDAVFERLQRRCPRSDDLVEYIRQSAIRICTLGADAEALVKYHLQPHIQPRDASTLGLVKELEDRQELQDARILCPVPSVRGRSVAVDSFGMACCDSGGLTEPVVIPRFLEALRAGGADVERLDVYVTQPGCPPEACTAERRLLENGEIDAIIFSSTAEAQGLVLAMGSLSALQDLIHKHSIVLAAHGPFTAAGVTKCLGVEVPCISQNYKNFTGVIKALETRMNLPQTHSCT